VGLSSYVWFSQMGFPHNDLQFPYKRQSPVTKKNREYNTLEEVQEEIELLSDTFSDSQFTLGRNLYFILPLFCNPRMLVKQEYIDLIKEYNYMKNYNIPMARSLDEADSYKLDCFDIIQRELNAITQYIGENNG
tara:strand:- start:166 stop:567 length:402 start_codon:yes stop_codon:yes gene_type:complete